MFDIKDLYVNIPIRETLRIDRKYLITENDEKTTEQIITLLHVTLQQNYFTFGNCIYQPEKGVSMGSPLSCTTAEILLQDIENTYIKHILDTQTIYLLLTIRGRHTHYIQHEDHHSRKPVRPHKQNPSQLATYPHA